MRAATLFSGIGAPEQARPDWQWLWHAEIEPFPAAVLAARHSGSVNLGDVSADDFAERAERVGRPDILVFGSPCQSFSVAGKRLGLSDPRGNLALVALTLVGRLRPRWFCFENVPGLLSNDRGRDFQAFLGAVAECGYFGSWRVLDARYWGLAQRRERVFFVGSLGDWRGPAAVLSLAEGLHGYPEKSREAREDVAATLTRGAESGGRGGYAGRRREDDVNLVSMCLNAHPSRRMDAESETLLPCWSLDLGNLGDGGNIGWRDGALPTHTLDCNGNIGVAHILRADGFDASEDGTGRGTPLAPVAFDTTQITSLANRSNPKPGDPCHPLAAGAHAPAVAFNWQSGGDCRGLELHDTAMALQRQQIPAMLQPLQSNQTIGITERTLSEPADADAFEANAGKVLRDLREQIGEEAFSEWSIGVLASFREAEILLGSLLRELASQRAVRREMDIGAHDGAKPSPGRVMRAMWSAGRARRSPPQPGPSRQSARELRAYLSELPQQGAPPASLLRDLRQAALGTRLLRDALSALEKARRPDESHREAEIHVQGMRQAQSGKGALRQALHASETRATQVRRLSVIECARLQGFPDTYAHIITKRWRKICAEEARYLASHGLPVEERAGGWHTPVPADGPMYKALGNSMAVPVLRWLLTRIEAHEAAMSAAA